ncbi:hypothetical protein PUN28_000440 [Cardiocondyla obscurior]|uniref:Uncharacterized protein n=1 Tax=Cardiocondyla obscurior TaxID=286306 RepID=A0AAW2GZV6_9HYME
MCPQREFFDASPYENVKLVFDYFFSHICFIKRYNLFFICNGCEINCSRYSVRASSGNVYSTIIDAPIIKTRWEDAPRTMRDACVPCACCTFCMDICIGIYKAVFFVKYEWSIAFLSHINIYVINNISFPRYRRAEFPIIHYAYIIDTKHLTCKPVNYSRMRVKPRRSRVPSWEGLSYRVVIGARQPYLSTYNSIIITAIPSQGYHLISMFCVLLLIRLFGHAWQRNLDRQVAGN